MASESNFGEGGIPIYPDGHKPADWTELKPDLLDKDNLVILGKPVMESWERPYMAALALTASQNGGRVLEIGFGLGIASSFIQSSPAGVTEHVVIEANGEVFKSLQDFASKAKVKVTPNLGLWQNVVSSLEDASFDGILFDTYPISEEELHTHQTTFFKHAYRLLKPGGVLSYCNLTSWGRLKLTQPSDRKMFEESQLPALLAAGFDANKCQVAVVSVDPPQECKYFTHKTVPVPVIVK